MTESSIPFLKGCNTCQKFQQCRFTCPVRTNQGDPLSPVKLNIKRLIDRVIIVCLVDIDQTNDSISTPWRGWKGEPYKFPLRIQFCLIQLIQHLYPALDLTGLRGLVSETFDKCLGLFYLFLLVLNRCLKDLPGLCPGSFKLVIISSVCNQLLTVHLHYAGCKPVHKIPVMGDQ